MDLALYSPGGYYASRVPGEGSDYRTSPSLSPWFGRLVARQLESSWNAMQRPEFTVIEAGGGSADLAHSVAAEILGRPQSGFANRLRWIFVERQPAVRCLQEDKMSGLPLKVDWVTDLVEVPPTEGVLLANEVLDNFPVRIYEVASGRIDEIQVGWDDGRFVEIRAESDLLETDFGREAASRLEVGDRFEVCPGLEPWIRKAAAAIRHGRVFLIDYGDPEPGIWLRNPAGSVVTYRQEQLGTDPFLRVGESDITHRVNFSAVQRAAAKSGFESEELVTQKQWLISLGLEGVLTSLRSGQQDAEAAGHPSDALAFIGERSRAAALGADGGLGSLLVFTASKPG
ncbi:MAG: SAM-dependent methyltransferase, partial [Actinomycetota bacterium]